MRKKALSLAQNPPNSIIVRPTKLLVFLSPTPLLLGPLQFLFLLPEAAFLLLISWPAPTSGISPNVASSRKPSETGLGASWCLNFPFQAHPGPSPPPSYVSGIRRGPGPMWLPHLGALAVGPAEGLNHSPAWEGKRNGQGGGRERSPGLRPTGVPSGSHEQGDLANPEVGTLLPGSFCSPQWFSLFFISRLFWKLAAMGTESLESPGLFSPPAPTPPSSSFPLNWFLVPWLSGWSVYFDCNSTEQIFNEAACGESH